jgi:YidC/Oxa1 family membrane protein insertase
MFDFIAYPMGQILNFLYNTVCFHSYGLAIILFTLVIRAALLPLTVKQYHSSAKMQTLQPQLQELQKRYKNDKEKLNMEMMKLYQDNKVNPAGGCLPLLVQMPILFSLYYDIQSPLKYMLGIKSSVISQLAAFVKTNAKDVVFRAGCPDIQILEYFRQFPDKIAEATSKVSSQITSDQISALKGLKLDFLGINLGLNPRLDTNLIFGSTTWTTYLPLMLIPILVAGSTFLQSKVMTKLQQGQTGAAASMNKSMMFMMPLMLLFFSFTVPAGLGLYWVVGNIVAILTQLYINKVVLNNKNNNKDNKEVPKK